MERERRADGLRARLRDAQRADRPRGEAAAAEQQVADELDAWRRATLRYNNVSSICGPPPREESIEQD